MSLRRSRRLRGLAPEENEIHQCCFICQLSIDVGDLKRCVSTPCCSVLMHRRCFNSMVERLPTCGNCRRPNVGHVSVVPDSDDEDEFAFSQATGMQSANRGQNLYALTVQLNEYRSESRNLNTHYYGSLLWEELPFPIDELTWRSYWQMLYDFANTYANNEMYVHGVVVMPVDITRNRRMIVYMLLIHNTPFAIFDLIETMRFRLFFWKDESVTSVELRRLTLLPHSGGPSVYPEDNEWVRDFNETL